MKRQHLIELGLISGATAGAALAGSRLPFSLPLGEIALIASGLLLGQGLVRDLWVKYSSSRNGNSASCLLAPAGRRATCVCMESTVGVFGIVAGVTLLLSGARQTVELFTGFWPLLVSGTGLLGFLLKNLVIDWKTRRVRVETNHEEIRF